MLRIDDIPQQVADDIHAFGVIERRWLDTPPLLCYNKPKKGGGDMFKRFFTLFISLFILAMFVGCNDTDVDHLSEEEQSAPVSDSFTSGTFFDVKEGDDLTNEELHSVISAIPSDKYESYPDTHNIPISATLYKDGKAISLDRDDPRLIKLINFFNNCVYHSQCTYTQGLLPLDYLEENIIASDFRLELKYIPCSDTGPSPYDKSTAGCDTIIITNTYSFTLIAHDLPGYQGQEELYPYRAVGFYPLYNNYSWLDLFGF